MEEEEEVGGGGRKERAKNYYLDVVCSGCASDEPRMRKGGGPIHGEEVHVM